MHLKLFISIAAAAFIGAAALAGYGYHRAHGLQVHDAGKTERTWQGSMDYCASLDGNWSVPSVEELYGIYLHGSLPIKATDYWSSTSSFGYAFGVNTSSGILSFDRHDDIDHVMCVKPIDQAKNIERLLQ